MQQRNTVDPFFLLETDFQWLARYVTFRVWISLMLIAIEEDKTYFLPSPGPKSVNGY